MDINDISDDNYAIWQVLLFDWGNNKIYIKWLIEYDLLKVALLLKTPEKEVNVLKSLYTGKAKDIFTYAYNLPIIGVNTADELAMAKFMVAKAIFANSNT